jgi:pimeloyl-ACP methyl ester carboxylesterase
MDSMDDSLVKLGAASIMIRKTFWYFTLVVVAAFLALVALGFDLQHDIAIPPGVAGRHVTVDGLTLRVADSGAGAKSVILLHGILGSVEDWVTVIPLLETKYRVIAIDRPGHGYSAEPREDNTVVFNARMVNALMSTLDLKDVVVVGHSYGGSIALRLALGNPPALHGVVLVAPGSYPDYPAGFLEKLMAAPLIGRGATRALIPLIGEERIRRDLAEALAPDNDVVPKNFFDLRVGLWKKPVPLRAYAEHLLTYNDDHARMAPEYPKIVKPVAILQGEADSSAPLRAGSQRLVREIPGATLKTFPATGHYLQYRQAQAVAEAVDQIHSMPTKYKK